MKHLLSIELSHLFAFDLQVGFGSGFKCNSAVWKALRTINSQHDAWKHLSKNASTEQDSKLRVENNTAEQAKTAQQNGSAGSLNIHHNGISEDAESISDKENKLCNGHTAVEQELKADLKANQADALANGDLNSVDSKTGKQGHLKHEESGGSGEIKAHSQTVNGKQANGTVAFL